MVLGRGGQNFHGGGLKPRYGGAKNAKGDGNFKVVQGLKPHGYHRIVAMRRIPLGGEFLAGGGDGEFAVFHAFGGDKGIGDLADDGAGAAHEEDF